MSGGQERQEPGKATLLAILNEVRAAREDIKNTVADHEVRIRALEKKHMKAAAVSGAIASVVVAAISAFAGSGCSHPNPGAMTRAATEQVNGYALWSDRYRGWTGTAWSIATDGKTSVLATAGHVCASDALLDGYYLDDGRVAVPIYDKDSPPFDDVCLLAVSGDSKPLRIGGVPTVGDQVLYTGYPDGVIGTYTGEVSGVGDNGTLLVSIPAYFGASGSALVDMGGRVVGLLSQGDMRFPHHSYWTGAAALHRAYDAAQVYLADMDAHPLQTVLDTITDSTLPSDIKD